MSVEPIAPSGPLYTTNLSARAKHLFPPAAARHTDLGVIKASGSRLWTDDGRELLDFGSGVAVTNVGHGHPDVLRAMHEQLDDLVHGGHNVAVYPSYVELAERLTRLAPGRDQEPMVFFANSGAESLEGAVKLAMHSTGRTGLVAFKRGFHGRTLTTTALSASAAAYRRGYHGGLPNVHHVDYPAPFANRTGPAAEVTRCLAELDELFELVIAPDQVATVVVEPFQGEGGYQPAPAEFLEGLRARADAHGIVLIFDEIQSGIGRTGRMFDLERVGVQPDVLVLAKGIANGLPLSALVGRRDLMERWPAGAHGGTFGGNPVACAAALAVLDVLEDGALDNAKRVGTVLVDGLREIVADTDLAFEVRGHGMMVGAELRHADWSPASDVVTEARSRCLADGLLVLSCGSQRNVLRLMPPTTLSTDDAQLALKVLATAIKASAVAAAS